MNSALRCLTVPSGATTALMPLCIVASWGAIQKRVKEYMIAFLMLETLMIGTFCALDLVVFYLFFEGGLIPMFLIIGVWGGPRRVYASFKFFLYTLLGSVLMLLAIMAMYREAGTTDIPTLLRHGFPPSKIAFLALHAWGDAAAGDWPPDFPQAKRAAYGLPEIRRWLAVFLDRFFRFSQFKRSALPNGPKVSAGGALSPRGDWRAPSDASARAWLDELARNVPEA